jgi:hypothetical protein
MCFLRGIVYYKTGSYISYKQKSHNHNGDT